MWGAGQKGHRRELILPKSFIPANPPKSSRLQILLEIPNVTFKLSKSLESQKTKKNYGIGGREPVSSLSFDLGKPNDPLIYQMSNLGSIFEQRCSNDLIDLVFKQRRQSVLTLVLKVKKGPNF